MKTPTTRAQAVQQGVDFYNATRACAYGHTGERSVRRGCLQCRRDYDRQRKEPSFQRTKIFELNTTENAHGAKSRAAKLQRTVKWASDFKMKQIYAEAKTRGMVVDHIIPLKGELVCGLHVETNLQLLTREENARKANRFDPDEHTSLPKNIQK